MTRLRAGMLDSYGGQAEVLSGAATTSAFAFATSLSEISVLVPFSERGALEIQREGLRRWKPDRPLRAGARRPAPSLCMCLRMLYVGAIGRPRSRQRVNSGIRFSQLPELKSEPATGSSRDARGIISDKKSVYGCSMWNVRSRKWCHGPRMRATQVKQGKCITRSR
jgi:hypothetical protein